MDKLSDDRLEVFHYAVASFLMEEAARGDASLVSMRAIEVPVGRDLKSIIYRDGGSGSTNKIFAFSFRDAVVETALPLLGIAITLFAGQFGIAAAPQIGGVLKTLWSKLIVLRRPADAEAIEVLEAICRVRARYASMDNEQFPSNSDIAGELGLEPKPMERALSRLKSLAVIEAVNWSGQADDISHNGGR